MASSSSIPILVSRSVSVGRRALLATARFLLFFSRGLLRWLGSRLFFRYSRHILFDLLVFGLWFVQVIFESANSWLQLAVHFQDVPLLNPGENDITESLFVEYLIDELIHVDDGKVTCAILPPQFSVVVVEWFEVLETVQGRAYKSHIEGS